MAADHGKMGATFTFGDRAENHKGMQIIGTQAIDGYKCDELRDIGLKLKSEGHNIELVDLGLKLPIEHGKIEACVLIIRNGASLFVDDVDKLWTELKSLTFDTKALMYGRVVNKKARHNLCFSEENQEPDYEAGKGRIVAFSDLKYLSEMRKRLPEKFGDKAKDLQCEANLYFNIDKCGIGPHGDSERVKVIGVRLGASFPLVFQWYLKSSPIGERVDIYLNHGDIYIMCQKTVGTDWKKRITPTLRHAAGCPKYLVMSGPKK